VGDLKRETGREGRWKDEMFNRQGERILGEFCFCFAHERMVRHLNEHFPKREKYGT